MKRIDVRALLADITLPDDDAQLAPYRLAKLLGVDHETALRAVERGELPPWLRGQRSHFVADIPALRRAQAEVRVMRGYRQASGLD